MAGTETPALSVELNPNTPKHVKDKKCPWCGQPFTSSSLGRHLDLYIRPNNPKKPDGIHDVTAIRRLRGTITRRRTKGTCRRRDASASAAGSAAPSGAPSKDGISPAPSDVVQSPAPPPMLAGTPAATHSNRRSVSTPFGRNFPFNTPWEATGVIDLSQRSNGVASHTEERQALPDGSRSLAPIPPPPPSHTFSSGQQPLHHQPDPRQLIQEAQDTARAAELALREMICSWRAAKLHVDLHQMPFDFDPLALDFPALVLQCLEPPPTIFSSTFYPTSTSWSLQPPGWDQFKALEKYFQDEFNKWHISCRAATTAVNEDLSYPPPVNFVNVDIKEAIRRSETINKTLGKAVSEHLKKTFGVWEASSQFDREKMWQLELARSVARKQKDINTLKEEQHRVRQENNNLKLQIEHLNVLQQPREYKLQTPATLPIEKKLIDYMSELIVVHEISGVGLEHGHRHHDLNTVCKEAIARWKKVVQSGRQGPPPPAPAPAQAPQQQQQQQQHQPVSEPQFPQTTSVPGGGPSPHNPLMLYNSAIAANYTTKNPPTSSNAAPSRPRQQQQPSTTAQAMRDRNKNRDPASDEEEDGDGYEEGEEGEEGDNDEEQEGGDEDAEMVDTEAEVQRSNSKRQPRQQADGSSGETGGGGSSGAGEPMKTN
ncbi:hypothetical protein QR685DRAFT_302978 [Neurospora intermedia]|uniref:C2H2-type domain-containing protein n=1 Tax=Neurospora intermedia TaxID=5142 RepID=A0ABR3DB97_NEUIN